MKRAYYLIFIGVLVGCGLANRDPFDNQACSGDSPEVHEKRLTAYESTLKGFLKGQTCNGCHGGSGSSAPYLFVSDDRDKSYAAARGLVDFLNSDESRMPQKIREGHNCGSQPCDSLASAISGQIASWIAGEEGLGSGVCSSINQLVLTSPQSIDPAALTTTSDVLLRWDLGALNSNFIGTAFQMATRRFADANGPQAAYQFWRPILATATTKYRVSNIEIFINGNPDPNSRAFMGTNFVVGPQAFSFGSSVWGSFPVINPAIQLRPLPEGSEQVSFQLSLTPTSDSPTPVKTLRDCKARGDFDGPVGANILNVKCSACHSSGGAGFSQFPMFGAGVNTCLQALMRSDTANPGSSLIIHKPNDPIAPHQLVTLTVQEQAAIQNWLTKEFQGGN